MHSSSWLAGRQACARNQIKSYTQLAVNVEAKTIYQLTWWTRIIITLSGFINLLSYGIRCEENTIRPVGAHWPLANVQMSMHTAIQFTELNREKKNEEEMRNAVVSTECLVKKCDSICLVWVLVSRSSLTQYIQKHQVITLYDIEIITYN